MRRLGAHVMRKDLRRDALRAVVVGGAVHGLDQRANIGHERGVTVGVELTHKVQARMQAERGAGLGGRRVRDVDLEQLVLGELDVPAPRLVVGKHVLPRAVGVWHEHVVAVDAPAHVEYDDRLKVAGTRRGAAATRGGARRRGGRVEIGRMELGRGYHELLRELEGSGRATALGRGLIVRSDDCLGARTESTAGEQQVELANGLCGVPARGLETDAAV